MVSFRLSGHDALDKKLAKLQHMEPELAKAAEQSVLYVHGQVPAYPPAPEGSDYVRTGTLGRTVTTMGAASGEALSRVETIGGRPTGVIGTALEYAPYVIDENQQAWMHAGRWWTLQDVVRRSRDGVVRIYEETIRKLTGAG